MKLLWLLALAIVAFRMFVGRWPWELGSGASGAAERSRARALLGVPPGASHQQVIEAHRRLVAMVHPDRGGTSEQVIEANAARDLLLGDLARRRPGGE